LGEYLEMRRDLVEGVEEFYCETADDVCVDDGDDGDDGDDVSNTYDFCAAAAETCDAEEVSDWRAITLFDAA